MNWYIVQAYSGFEKKVVDSIKEELKKHKLDDNLDQILIPTHQVTEVKKGKRTKKKKIFSRICFNKDRMDKTNIFFNKKSSKSKWISWIFRQAYTNI